MNSKQAFEKCRDSRERISELEPIIARSAKYSYLYAYFIVHGRFELGEKRIFKHPEYSFRYAHRVVRGKLPEEGHNRMIASSLVQRSEWTDNYFSMLKSYEDNNSYVWDIVYEYNKTFTYIHSDLHSLRLIGQSNKKIGY